jgi:glucokinase
MVPAGAPTEETVLKLAAHVEAGVIVIDGGNTYYKDDIRRARTLRMHGVHYIDVGTVVAFGVRSWANGSWMRITFPRRRPVLVIETDRLASRFHLESITLINDLKAAIFGLAALEPDDSVAVHAGSPDAML